MSLTTGTASGYGSSFAFPSGTNIVPAQVIGFPEMSMGERNITNHGNGGVEERVPNGLKANGDFTIQILSTPTALITLKTDMDAKTERVACLKNPVYSYTFTGWIKSIKEDDAPAESPDSVKAMIVVVPHGDISLANS